MSFETFTNCEHLKLTVNDIFDVKEYIYELTDTEIIKHKVIDIKYIQSEEVKEKGISYIKNPNSVFKTDKSTLTTSDNILFLNLEYAYIYVDKMKYSLNNGNNGNLVKQKIKDAYNMYPEELF